MKFCLAFLLSAFCFCAHAQTPFADVTLSQPIRSGVAIVYPMDLYPGALAAWGVATLTSAPPANLVEVRRVSDNTLSNAPVLASGFVDAVTMETWAGAGAYSITNTFVSRLYDQSGNGVDLRQTVSGLQPNFKRSLQTELPIVWVPNVDGCALTNASFAAYNTNLTIYWAYLGQRQTALGNTFDFTKDIPTFSMGPVGNTDLIGTATVDGVWPYFTMWLGGLNRSVYFSNAPPNLNVEVFSMAYGPSQVRMVSSSGRSVTTGSVGVTVNATGFRLFTGFNDGFNSKAAMLACLIYTNQGSALQDNIVAALRDRFSIPTRTAFAMFDGDSITAGYQTDWQGLNYQDVKELSWPGYVARTLGNRYVSWANSAVQSRTAEFCLLNITNRVLLLKNPNYTTNIYIFSAGINDISTNGTTAQVSATISNACKQAKGAGWGVIVHDLIPRGDLNGTQEAVRTNVNNAIAAYWTNYANAFVQVSTNGWLTAPTNYQDGIHPNALGVSRWASNSLPTIQSFLP